ncbi:MAG: helix-turn-helix domain-containing protein [Roseiflexaceae bacterium]
MVRKAFLYRLYPSRAQERLLDATLETCRHFYNDCLAERKSAYQERGETIGKYDQLRQEKNAKPPTRGQGTSTATCCRQLCKTSIQPSLRSFGA